MNNIVKSHPSIEFDIKQITRFDPETLTTEFIKRIFDTTDIQETEGNTFYNKFKLPHNTLQENFISNCLKHMDAFNRIAKDATDDDINIILEDDVMFDDTFEDQLMKFIDDKIFESYDIIFFGLPSQDDDSSENKGMYVQPLSDPTKVLPCCDSYYISKPCATKLSSSYIPIRYPNNIQLSYVIDMLKQKTGRLVPNMMADGSKIGFFPSTISSNNILLFNNIYKKIYKILDQNELKEDDIEAIKQLLEQNKIKHSPDFLFIEGLFYLRTKEFKKCKDTFDEAIKLYEQHRSPLNNQSAIIQNYIELCRYLQDEDEEKID
jgi:GR25 family glycosyltransferase involved in LPS biosynthesis